MRKLILMVGLVAVAVACGTAGDMVGEMLDSGVPDAGAQPTPTPVAKFVGYTSEGHRLSINSQDDDGGLFSTYAACQSDFGTTARICTVAEVLGTVDLPAPPPPPQTGSGVAEGAWMVERLDNTPSCWGAGSESPYLTPEGEIYTNSCNNIRVLACCTVN